MSTNTPEPDEHDFEQRMDEERAEGTVHRPPQVAAEEDLETSVSEELRATGDASS